MKQVDQFTLHYAKEGDGDNTHWPQIGRAFVEEERIVIKVDSLPMPEFWSGGRLFLYPAKKK